MKSHFIVLFTVILLVSTSFGCLDKLTEKSLVLHLNLSVTGDYQHPVIDAAATDRYLEMLPVLKQKRYDTATEKPYLHCVAFYNKDKISYYTSVPYNGPGNYLMTIVFEEGKTLPKSSNEAIIAHVQFVDANGAIIGDEYFSIRWP